MAAESGFTGVRASISWGPEWPMQFTMTRWALDPANAHGIWTAGAGIWNAVAGGYAPPIYGQPVYILNGANAGTLLHIADTESDATPDDYIIFEEDLTVYWAGFAVTDRIAIFSSGMAPADIALWELVAASPLADIVRIDQ